MEIRKVVQVVDSSHARLNQYGVLVDIKGEEYKVRFAPDGGMWKFGNKTAMIPCEEEVFEAKQLKQEAK